MGSDNSGRLRIEWGEMEQMRLARQEFRVKKGLATIIEMKAYKKEAKKRAKAGR
jgi:hypothetical protein